MENHPIENLMKSTMESLKEMIDVNTIVGSTVETADGSLIIPISKVSFGFASGGGEYGQKSSTVSNYPFGGGSGAGVTLKPVAFLVIKGESIRLLSLDAQNTCDKIVDSIPQVIDMLKGLQCKNKNKKSDKNSVTAETPDTDDCLGC